MGYKSLQLLALLLDHWGSYSYIELRYRTSTVEQNFYAYRIIDKFCNRLMNSVRLTNRLIFLLY